jgi:VanZ family protein
VSGPRKWYALLALGSAAFTLAGSLVPFDFRAVAPGEALDTFKHAMAGRLAVVSRSDAAVNVMLGVPLGFALLGWLSADRGLIRSRVALRGLAVLPACAVFAALVEFTQVFTPSRMPSGLDVLAQTLGAALGMVLWLACGQWLTNEVRKAATGTGTAARFLVAYLAFLGFIEALPLDLSASPYAAYRKFRDGGVKPIPFREFGGMTEDEVLKRIGTLLELAGLYLPVGLLAARLPDRFWRPENAVRVALAALAVALVIEMGQVLVRSRTTSATDVLVGGGVAFLGWAIGKAFRNGRNFQGMYFLGALWWVALLWVSWQPFEVAAGVRIPFDWVPGGPLEGGNPLWALEEMLTKLVAFGLGGAILAGTVYGRPGRRTHAVAAVMGLFAAAFFEFGQTRFLHHTPCVTDVLLGGLGAFCGVWMTSKVRSGEPGSA